MSFMREGVEYNLTVNVFTPEKWGKNLEISAGNSGRIDFDTCGLKPEIEIAGKGSQYLSVTESGGFLVSETVDKKKTAKVIFKYGKKKYAVKISILPSVK